MGSSGSGNSSGSSGGGSRGAARGKVEVTYFHKPPDRLRTLLETPVVGAGEPAAREPGRVGPRDTIREMPALLSARPRAKEPRGREREPARGGGRTTPRATPRVTPSDRPKAGRRRTTTLEAPVVEAEAPSAPSRSPKGRRTGADGIVRHGVQTLGEKRVAEMALFGHHLFEQGKLREAKAIFEGLVELGVQDAFPHTMLGILFLTEDEPDRALALFEAALALEPDDLAARVYRAELHLKAGKGRGALEELRRVVHEGPPEDPFVARARQLLSDEDPKGATARGEDDRPPRRRR